MAPVEPHFEALTIAIDEAFQLIITLFSFWPIFKLNFKANINFMTDRIEFYLLPYLPESASKTGRIIWLNEKVTIFLNLYPWILDKKSNENSKILILRIELASFLTKNPDHFSQYILIIFRKYFKSLSILHCNLIQSTRLWSDFVVKKWC